MPFERANLITDAISSVTSDIFLMFLSKGTIAKEENLRS